MNEIYSSYLDIPEVNVNSIQDMYMIKRRNSPNKKVKRTSNEGDINILNNINNVSSSQLRNLANQTTTTKTELSSLISSNFVAKFITTPKEDNSTKNSRSIVVDSTNFKKSVNTPNSQISMKKVVVSQINTTSSNPNMYNHHQQNINELMLNNKYKILPHILIKESKHGNLTIPVLPSFLTDRT